jgi:hypothetical protein
VARAYEVLRGPETAFVLVTSPEEQVLGDAEYLSAKMSELSMPLRGVVFNRVHREMTRAKRRGSVHEIDAGDIVQIAGAIGRALKGEPRLARELAQNFLDYEVLARGEQLRMEQFEVGLADQVPVVRVPNFPRDVHDLRALAAMHEHLFAA